VRFAYGRTAELSSLFTGYLQRFNLYCGQVQRTLTDEQKEIMRQIAVYVVNEGAFSLSELNSFDTDLWRRGITGFGNNPNALSSEIQQLSRFILKVA
jgi:type I restriction enzyme R subunit